MLALGVVLGNPRFWGILVSKFLCIRFCVLILQYQELDSLVPYDPRHAALVERHYDRAPASGALAWRVGRRGPTPPRGRPHTPTQHSPLACRGRVGTWCPSVVVVLVVTDPLSP